MTFFAPGLNDYDFLINKSCNIRFYVLVFEIRLESSVAFGIFSVAEKSTVVVALSVKFSVVE